jgi:hypothetical protein
MAGRLILEACWLDGGFMDKGEVIGLRILFNEYQSLKTG